MKTLVSPTHGGDSDADRGEQSGQPKPPIVPLLTSTSNAATGLSPPFAKSKLPYRTAKLSSYEAYRASENDDPDERLCAHEERDLLLLQFPFAVMLEVAYPEMDFANRWCWETFGPKDGRCYQFQSNYPCCLDPVEHEHQGVWSTHWFAKTDYDFGFNEWYFRDRQHHDMFLAFVPMINWGERFPD